MDSSVAAELERIAVLVAEEAGRLIEDERPADLGVAQTKSSATDVVTVMDQRAQDLLRERLMGRRPDDAFFGEEDGGEAGTSGLTWVVDPIDGTVNYLYGIPAYAVSVAAVLGDPSTPGGWEPVAGAVCNPRSGETWHAYRGGGAWRTRDGSRHPVRASGADELATALVGTGFGYRARRRTWQVAALTHVLPRVRDIRRMGSAALDLCAVAEGRLDGYYERGLNPWDMAAGVLVVEEAGGVVTGLDGPPSESMVIASGPRLAAPLAGLVGAAARQAGDEAP
ncbi:MAG: inositol monophosphatase [Micrococcales bacterium]|nr:inositol monophosphatase [Micrococcales bacterium]